MKKEEGKDVVRDVKLKLLRLTILGLVVVRATTTHSYMVIALETTYLWSNIVVEELVRVDLRQLVEPRLKKDLVVWFCRNVSGSPPYKDECS